MWEFVFSTVTSSLAGIARPQDRERNSPSCTKLAPLDEWHGRRRGDIEGARKLVSDC